jgi:putative lipoprotein
MKYDQKEIRLHTLVAVLVVGIAFVVQAPEPAPTPVPAPAAGKPSAEMRRAVEWKRFDYACQGGAKVTVYLHNETVKVRFKENTYFMKQVRSADGGKYSDGKVVWWGVGDGGFLQEDSPDGNGAMMAKECKLDKPMNPAQGSNTVTGTVSYLVRMALPPAAVIQVQLLDVSLADAPAKVLAEEKITLGERQVPVPFTLTADPMKLEPNHSYSVSARILVDGVLRFINDKSYPVITEGNPNHVELLLKPVAAPAAVKP